MNRSVGERELPRHYNKRAGVSVSLFRQSIQPAASAEGYSRWEDGTEHKNGRLDGKMRDSSLGIPERIKRGRTARKSPPNKIKNTSTMLLHNQNHHREDNLSYYNDHDDSNSELITLPYSLTNILDTKQRSSSKSHYDCHNGANSMLSLSPYATLTAKSLQRLEQQRKKGTIATAPGLNDYLLLSSPTRHHKSNRKYSIQSSQCSVITNSSISVLSSVFNANEIEDCLESTASSVVSEKTSQSTSSASVSSYGCNSVSKSCDSMKSETKQVTTVHQSTGKAGSSRTMTTVSCSSSSLESHELFRATKTATSKLSTTQSHVSASTLSSSSFTSVYSGINKNENKRIITNQSSTEASVTPIAFDDETPPTKSNKKLNDLRAKHRMLRNNCHRKLTESRASLQFTYNHENGSPSSLSKPFNLNGKGNSSTLVDSLSIADDFLLSETSANEREDQQNGSHCHRGNIIVEDEVCYRGREVIMEKIGEEENDDQEDETIQSQKEHQYQSHDRNQKQQLERLMASMSDSNDTYEKPQSEKYLTLKDVYGMSFSTEESSSLVSSLYTTAYGFEEDCGDSDIISQGGSNIREHYRESSLLVSLQSEENIDSNNKSINDNYNCKQTSNIATLPRRGKNKIMNKPLHSFKPTDVHQMAMKFETHSYSMKANANANESHKRLPRSGKIGRSAKKFDANENSSDPKYNGDLKTEPTNETKRKKLKNSTYKRHSKGTRNAPHASQSLVMVGRVNSKKRVPNSKKKLEKSMNNGSYKGSIVSSKDSNHNSTIGNAEENHNSVIRVKKQKSSMKAGERANNNRKIFESNSKSPSSKVSPQEIPSSRIGRLVKKLENKVMMNTEKFHKDMFLKKDSKLKRSPYKSKNKRKNKVVNIKGRKAKANDDDNDEHQLLETWKKAENNGKAAARCGGSISTSNTTDSSRSIGCNMDSTTGSYFINVVDEKEGDGEITMDAVPLGPVHQDSKRRTKRTGGNILKRLSRYKNFRINSSFISHSTENSYSSMSSTYDDEDLGI